MKHLHLGALCAALAGVWPTFALGAPAEAADPSLKQLREQVRELRESYEQRIQALEKRLAEAEGRATQAQAVARQADVRVEAVASGSRPWPSQWLGWRPVLLHLRWVPRAAKVPSIRRFR